MRTVIIYDETMESQIGEPKSENTVCFPMPNFMENELKNTRDALQVARRMRAEKIIIYRNLKKGEK